MEYAEQQSNRALGIEALPIELISIILLEVVSDLHEGDTYADWEARVELSSVCKEWRNLALETPEFWAGVSLHPECKQIGAMLPRWKSHPRKVFLVGEDDEEHTPTYNRDLQAVLESDLLQAERLGELYFSWGVEKGSNVGLLMTDSLWKYFLRHENLPVLTYLHIECDYNNSWGIPVLSVHRLGESTQILQHLSLENCIVEWDAQNSHRNSDLGSMNLLTLRLGAVHPPPPNTVLSAMLSNCSRLTSLHLDLELLEDFVPPSDWIAPFLQDVQLEGDHRPYARILLKILSMRPSAAMQAFSVEMEYSDTHHSDLTEDEIISQWTRWLITPFGRWKSWGRQLHIREAYDGLTIWAAPCPARLVEEAEESMDPTAQRFHFKLKSNRPPGPLTFIRDIQLPPHIDSLALDMSPGFHTPSLLREVWEGFLGRHPNITTLAVHGANAQEFLEFLDFNCHRDPEAADLEYRDNNEVPSVFNATIYLPGLRNLFFHHTSFHQCQNHSGWLTGVTGLQGILRRREKAGATPLAVLQFTRCPGVSSGDVEGLQEAFVERGPRVLWEG